jgi:hypothetical protein
MKKFYKILWKIIFIIFYPIITAFSLLFTGLIVVFSGLSKWLTRLSESEEQELQQAEQRQEWKPFLQLDNIELTKRKENEVLFGPTYYKLQSAPRFPELDSYFWGQFNFPCFGGILLQKWNSVKEHELDAFDLVYLDPVRKQLKKLDTLPTYEWKVSQLDAESVLVEWFNGKGRLVIRLADIA